MTQEQKAKAYDEAIERAKQVALTKEHKSAAEYIFPELAESEDERIEEFISNIIDNLEPKDFVGIKKMDVIAWLERQKEQKPSVEEVLIKAGLKPYKDGNQWCILIGDNIQEGICGFGDAIEDALFELLKDIKEQSGVKRMRR